MAKELAAKSLAKLSSSAANGFSVLLSIAQMSLSVNVSEYGVPKLCDQVFRSHFGGVVGIAFHHGARGVGSDGLESFGQEAGIHLAISLRNEVVWAFEHENHIFAALCG